MNRKIIIVILFTTGFLLNACQKNIDVFVPDAGQLNGPDTSWYSSTTSTMPVAELKNNISPIAYTDSFQVNNNTAYINTPFGLQCGFPPNSCVGNAGQAITGTVQVELMLVKKKGDMIKLNKPTTSNDRLLVSGGEIFIRLKKDNQELQLASNIKIQLRYPADLPISTQMKLFMGVESNPERFNWLPNTDLVNNTLTITPQNYEIQTNHLRWINADYFYDTLGISRVSVTAELASYFTNANTIAYTVFKDFRSVAGMYGDNTTRKFSTGKLPVGKAITVVVISKQGNDYFLGFQNTTTTVPASNTGIQPVAITPVKKSLSDILNFLSTL